MRRKILRLTIKVLQGEDTVTCCPSMRFLIGRRKILRLYFWGASIIYMICRYIKTMARACNDAKSCVSRLIHCKVRTLLRAVLQCGFQSGDARFCVSTQARAMIITGMSQVRQSSYSLCRSVPAAFMTYCTSMRAVSISMV